MARAVDTYISYKFIQGLTTPWTKTKAYKLGLIDSNGKKIRSAETTEEKNAYTYFDRLVFNIKRIISKAPGGKSQIASYGTALLLLKEEYKDQLEDPNMFEKLLKKHLTESKIDEEEGPTNTSGSGQMKGKDMPLFLKKRKKKKKEEDEEVGESFSAWDDPNYRAIANREYEEGEGDVGYDEDDEDDEWEECGEDEDDPNCYELADIEAMGHSEAFERLKKKVDTAAESVQYSNRKTVSNKDVKASLLAAMKKRKAGKKEKDKKVVGEGKTFRKVVRNKKIIRKAFCDSKNQHLEGGRCVPNDSKFKKRMRISIKKRKRTMRGKSLKQAIRKRKISTAKLAR